MEAAFATVLAMGFGWLFGTLCSEARHEWGRSDSGDKSWTERDEQTLQELCRLKREAVQRGEHIVP